MLKRLVLKNFQTHATFKLNLDPHVTTIIGPSDSGKSAIIRAIKWLCLNKPRGKAFIRDGERKVSVIIRTKKHKITRTTGKENAYILDKRKLTAFGADVPPDVQTALRVDEINFQGQHDKPFWFAESAGEVSRQLNEIVDLSIIDTTLANLASMLRESKAEEAVIDKRLEHALSMRKQLKKARHADRALQRVERYQRRIQTRAERKRRLQELLGEAVTLRKQSARLRQAVTQSEKLAKLEAAWEASAESRSTLEVLTLRGRNFQKVVDRGAVPHTGRLQALSSWIRHRSEVIEELDRLIRTGIRERIIHEELQDDLKKARKEQKDLVGDICPLCGQILP